MPFDPALDTVRLASGRSVSEAINDLRKRVPSERALAQAADVWVDPSPAMVEGCARWIDLLDELRAVLTPVQILELGAHACTGAYDGMDVAPPEELLEGVLADAGGSARPWAEALVSEQLETTDSGPLRALAASAATLLIGTQPAARLLELATFYASAKAVRRLVENASPADRARWLHGFLGVAEMMKRNPSDGARFIFNRLERVLGVLDLCAAADVAEACEVAKQDKRWKDLEPRIARALKGERDDPPRPTAAALEAVAYLEGEYARARRAAMLPTAAASAATRAVAVEDAAELRDRARWTKAKPARRRAILRRVADALGEGFTLDGSTFTHVASGVEFVIVPGGKFRMGFSKKEEALVRKAAKQNEGIENWFEEFGALLEGVSSMRPVHEVRVAPFLVSVAPLSAPAIEALLAGDTKRKRRASRRKPEPEVVALAEIVDLVEATPFRLLSEAEWEYAARAGRKSELTPFGDDVPNDAAFRAYSKKLPPNDFGLTSLGLYPEVCSDTLRNEQGPGYEGAPIDGSPRTGELPCVVRGGAAWLYPWQACGEWQLLCNAVRSSTGAWDDQAAVRLAIGVRAAGR